MFTPKASLYCYYTYVQCVSWQSLIEINLMNERFVAYDILLVCFNNTNLITIVSINNFVL